MLMHHQINMAKAIAGLPKKENQNNRILPSPPYFTMITEAIATLKDGTGSSQPAIAKFIEDKYKNCVTANFRKVLSVQLKKFVKSERLVKVKNSYKISSTEKLKLAAKETHKATKKKKISETNMLSQVKTPKILKKIAKTKRLSEVKTPQGFKKVTPMKRKSSKAGSCSSSRSQKKVKK